MKDTVLQMECTQLIFNTVNLIMRLIIVLRVEAVVSMTLWYSTELGSGIFLIRPSPINSSLDILMRCFGYSFTYYYINHFKIKKNVFIYHPNFIGGRLKS